MVRAARRKNQLAENNDGEAAPNGHHGRMNNRPQSSLSSSSSHKRKDNVVPTSNSSLSSAASAKKQQQQKQQHGEQFMEYKPHNQRLIVLDGTTTWYEYCNEYDERNATIRTHPPPPPPPPQSSSSGSSTAVVSVNRMQYNTREMITKYRSMADAIYGREIQLFEKEMVNNSDQKWVESTMKRGTIRDRVAATSVVLGTDPIHKFYTIDGLLQMMGCSLSVPIGTSRSNNNNNMNNKQTNYRVAQLAAEAIEDLFLKTFLPPSRKLISLANRPLYLYESIQQMDNSTTTDDENDDDNKNSNKQKKSKKKNKNNQVVTTKKTLSPRILLLWRYEELVKEKYDIFIRQYLSYTMMSMNDNVVESHKVSAIKIAANLLRNVPEGEAELLQMLVNKIGDPMKKISARASHELRLVLEHHPVMQVIIAREVQQLVHRPNLSHKALYKCIIFLNQLKLTKNNTRSSSNNTTMVDTTLGTDNFCLAASLIKTYFRLFEIAVEHHPTNNKDRGSISRNKKTIKGKGSSIDDTTSNAMKSRLLSALLTGVNRAHPYLPEKDQDMDEHIDSLYRVVHTAQPAAVTQSLLLLFHVAVGVTLSSSDGGTSNSSSSAASVDDNVMETTITREKRKERFYRALYSTLSNSDMLGCGTKHLTMYFNLLYKAMKYDTHTSRIVAFGKKILSMSIHCSSNVVNAALFLMNEVCTIHPNTLLTCYTHVLRGIDAVRVLDPTKREPRGALRSIYSLSKKSAPTTPNKNNNDHNDNNNNKNDGSNVDGDNDNDDSGCNEESRSPGWEICLALNHFHPSVQMFAQEMGSKDSGYTGDPLRDFALSAFLDKFAYKNPKKSIDPETTTKTETKSDVIAGVRTSDSKDMIESQLLLPFNDPSFLETTIQKQNVHDEFFYNFFKERAKRDSMKGIVRVKDNNTKKKVTDDDDEDEIDALNRQEKHDGDADVNPSFDWETDSEEEAFVDSLSQKIMEDACGDDPDFNELDDEDPDMDDWDDLRKSNFGDDDNFDDEDSADDDDAEVNNNEDNDDYEIDDGGDDDDEGDEDDEADVDPNSSDEDGDAFMDDDDDNSEDEGGSDNFEPNFFCDEVDAEEFVNSIHADDDVKEKGKSKKRRAELPTFASAEEYEELINASWKKSNAMDFDEKDLHTKKKSLPSNTSQLNKKTKVRK